MAFSDSGAVLRPDVNTLVQEAASVDDLFIADKVFPVYASDRKLGQYPKFRLAKGELMNDDASVRTPTSAYNRVFRAYENDNFQCADRGLEELVDDTYREDISRYFDAETVAARQCLLQLRLGLEVRVAAQLFDTAQWTHTASSVAYTEANLATINFPKDVMDAVDRLYAKGARANTLVISNLVANRVKRSTIFQNFVRGNLPAGQPIIVSNSDFVRAFGDYGITQVLIGRVSKNAAKKGQAYSASQVWLNTEMWVGNVQSGDPMNGGAGRTFVWNQEGGLFVTESYRDEIRRSNVIRVRQNTAEKIIDISCGELIDNSYA